jgi:hypothetical protein
MADTVRTLLGFLVAPISPGLLALIAALPHHIATGGFGARELSEVTWILKLAAVLSYPVAIVCGVPLYVLLRSRGWNGLLIYIASGALLGLIVYAAYVLLPEYAAGGPFGLAGRFGIRRRCKFCW